MTADATATEAASRDRLAGVLHVATLVVGFTFSLALGGQQWFRADEWTILTDRSAGDALQPHNEHWFTFPILVLRGLFATIGLDSYLPYVLPTVVLHVISAHLVWRIIRRGGGDAWVATVAAAVVLTLGAGFENVTLAVQVAFTAPLALGLGHVLLVDHPGPVGRRDALGAVVGTVAVAWSGIGPVMVAAAALTAALRRGWWAAAVAAGPPGVVYATWWLAVGRGAVGALPPPAAVATFVATGLTHAAGETLHIGAWGAVALLVLVGWLVWRWRLARGPAAAVFACAAAAVVALLAGGVLRADDDPGLARSSRYAAVAATLLLPAAGWALGRAAARRPPVR
ncbi:MAG: hypothetical protein M3N57_10525, partial [Actinomycetota bacterium]|nr:hypothetical protein [Actinomycetota bacterium]